MPNHPTFAPLDRRTQLNDARRDRDRQSAQKVDVVVIGGGITGVGVALDAAARGLDVVLLEKHDLAFGTSRWSSKLAHGGLRYLAQGQLGVALESSRERSVLATQVAPHLIAPLPQVVPDFDEDRRTARLAMAGFRAGNVLRAAAGTPRSVLPAPRRVTAETALQLVPGLRQTGLRGAAVGWECQLIDDARLVIAIARTAAGYGAKILLGAEAAAVDTDSGEVIVRDHRHGDTFTISAGTIVNAAGVWAGEFDQDLSLEPSLGTHVVMPTALVGAGRGSLTVPVPGHTSRFVFALPQPEGVSYVGITDRPSPDGIVDVPMPPEEDVEWILDILSGALQQPVNATDSLGAFAGLRPLVADPTGGHSADLSRKQLLRRNGRMLSIVGGKLTTYRQMAQDVVDEISHHPCPTATLPLVGASNGATDAQIPDVLRRCYGSEAAAVWQAGRDSSDDTVDPTVAARLQFGRDFEGAVNPTDLLERRTRLGLLPVPAAVSSYAQQLCSADN
ncbi:MAG: glycerol-3-phosphate dehydrogenase/oxidase [Actinomycetia bacterium]|nr:glycerol-3-phosphate dehydrogenase/oxidase [Actinomycetes bacterium]